MSKKIMSILLAVVLAFSMVTIAVVSVSAAVDADGRYVPSEGVTNTNKYYFYMPASWKTNDQVTTAGVYWFGGTDACSAVDGTGNSYKWPGYKMQVEGSVKDLYYLDCPSDVETIIFNNFFDGGEDSTDPKYVQAVQTMNIDCSYYAAEDADDEAVGVLGDEDYIPYHQTTAFFEDAQAKVEAGDTEALGQFADNFIESEYGFAYTYSNMIFIVDSANTVENELNGKTNYVGYWYFYYGDGTYGTRLTPEEAEAAGERYSLADQASKDEELKKIADDKKANGTNNNGVTTGNGANDNSVPAPATDATSTADTVKGTASTDNTAVQTGEATYAVVFLSVLIAAAGAIYFTRKRLG